MLVVIPFSMPVKTKSVSCARHESVEKFALKPDWSDWYFWGGSFFLR